MTDYYLHRCLQKSSCMVTKLGVLRPLVCLFAFLCWFLGRGGNCLFICIFSSQLRWWRSVISADFIHWRRICLIFFPRYQFHYIASDCRRVNINTSMSHVHVRNIWKTMVAGQKETAMSIFQFCSFSCKPQTCSCVFHFFFFFFPGSFLDSACTQRWNNYFQSEDGPSATLCGLQLLRTQDLPPPPPPPPPYLLLQQADVELPPWAVPEKTT